MKLNVQLVPLRQPFRYESITGSIFTGEALAETEIAGAPGLVGIIPQITGSAHITGMNDWVLDERDALRYGFLLGRACKTAEHGEGVQERPRARLCGA